jgi:hypothetical protein
VLVSEPVPVEVWFEVRVASPPASSDASVFVEVPETLELAAEVADDVPAEVVEDVLAPVPVLRLELVLPPSSPVIVVSLLLPPHAATTTANRTP